MVFTRAADFLYLCVPVFLNKNLLLQVYFLRGFIWITSRNVGWISCFLSWCGRLIPCVRKKLLRSFCARFSLSSPTFFVRWTSGFLGRHWAYGTAGKAYLKLQFFARACDCSVLCLRLKLTLRSLWPVGGNRYCSVFFVSAGLRVGVVPRRLTWERYGK